MVSVPLCVRFNRSVSTSGMPSLYQAIVTIGPPIVLHGSVAIDLIGSVWFAGPCTIIGGGRSSCVFIESTTRVLVLPTPFTALQTIILPASMRWMFCIDISVRPSGVSVTSTRSCLKPGNISVRFPSIDQNVVGFGNPFAWHSNIASLPNSTSWVFGRIENVGGAEKVIYKWVINRNRWNYLNCQFIYCLLKVCQIHLPWTINVPVDATEPTALSASQLYSPISSKPTFSRRRLRSSKICTRPKRSHKRQANSMETLFEHEERNQVTTMTLINADKYDSKIGRVRKWQPYFCCLIYSIFTHDSHLVQWAWTALPSAKLAIVFTIHSLNTFDDGKVKMSCTHVRHVRHATLNEDIPKFIINRNQHQIQFIRRIYGVRAPINIECEAVK